VYRISNISAVVELSRVEVGGRVRARWPKTRGGRKLGGLAYGRKEIIRTPYMCIYYLTHLVTYILRSHIYVWVLR
jgi:hypothetical protein